MEPLEAASRLAGSSNRCEKHKCPFMAQCKGDYATCAFKEIALIIRSQNASIEKLTEECRALVGVLSATSDYINSLEKTNKKYHDIIVAFEHGYRPKNAARKKRIPRRLKDPTRMDGDARYEQSEDNKKEPNRVTVIG